MAFKFRLIDEDGNDLGPFVTSEPDWRAGHQIHRRSSEVLEVLRLVDASDGDDVSGYLVVRAA